MSSCPRDAVASKIIWKTCWLEGEGVWQRTTYLLLLLVSVDITNTDGVDSVALSTENPIVAFATEKPSKSLPVTFLMRVRWGLEIGDWVLIQGSLEIINFKQFLRPGPGTGCWPGAWQSKWPELGLDLEQELENSSNNPYYGLRDDGGGGVIIDKEIKLLHLNTPRIYFWY